MHLKTNSSSSFIANTVNLDITSRCTLLCSRCTRQSPVWKNELKTISSDISMDEYRKLLEYFDRLIFCGTVGDPVFHPDFIEMLDLAKGKERTVEVFTAASHRPRKWYREAFETHPDAKWTFGIDGLPADSHRHRVNQNGEYLFEMMVLAAELGLETEWQHIVFNYNQDTLDDVKALAAKHSLNLNICLSSRWRGPEDPLKPDDQYIMARNPGRYEKGDVLDPACFQGHPIGHSSQGYIVPCCWMTNVDVEESFPDLCNESTRIANVDRIDDIIERWGAYGETLKNEPQRCYQVCWDKCNKSNSRGRKTFERVRNSPGEEAALSAAAK